MKNPKTGQKARRKAAAEPGTCKNVNVKRIYEIIDMYPIEISGNKVEHDFIYKIDDVVIEWMLDSPGEDARGKPRLNFDTDLGGVHFLGGHYEEIKQAIFQKLDEMLASGATRDSWRLNESNTNYFNIEFIYEKPHTSPNIHPSEEVEQLEDKSDKGQEQAERDNRPRLPADPISPAHALRSLATGLPTDIEERAASLAEIHREYRQEMIPLLQPVINARIQRMAASSLSEKRNVVKSINEEMKNYGLSVRCEVRDKEDQNVIRGIYPGNFVVDTSRSTDEVGRFRVEYQGDDGRAKRAAVPTEPDEIVLMVSPFRRDQDLGVKDHLSFVEKFTQKGEIKR